MGLFISQDQKLSAWTFIGELLLLALNFLILSLLWPEYFIDFLCERWIPCQASTSVLCLHYRPETVHCSTKDAYTSEITFLALHPCLYVLRYVHPYILLKNKKFQSNTYFVYIWFMYNVHICIYVLYLYTNVCSDTKIDKQ